MKEVTMSMIFQIRMIGTEDDGFLRDYELPYDTNLFDFHKFICSDLGYDPMSMASFFLSNERWEQGREFTLMDMGGDADPGPVAMEKITLGQILLKNNDRLIYVFDPFAERVLFLELLGTVRSCRNAEYPFVALAQGTPPVQFLPDAAGLPPDGSIFDQAMEGFFEFEGDDYDDDF